MISKKERDFINSKIVRFRQYYAENIGDYNRTGDSYFRDQAVMCQAKAECLENLLISLDMAKFEMGGRPV